MKITLLTIILLFTNIAFSDITLNTSGVYIETSDGEGVIYVTNNSDYPTIVYAREETNETKELSGESLIFVSPPVSKLESGKTQLLRVMIKKENLKEQKLSRLLIQEVPYVENPNNNQVTFNKSYNIPVLINPKGLVENFEPWLVIKKENIDGKNYISNYTRYLVKILPSYKCHNQNKSIVMELASPYLQPKSRLEIGSCEKIEINPISNEGQIFDSYTIK